MLKGKLQTAINNTNNVRGAFFHEGAGYVELKLTRHLLEPVVPKA